MKEITHHTIKIFGILFMLTACQSVKYSMTGASLHPDCKTFSIQFFDNRAPVVNPTLSNDFTEELKEKFRSQTNLEEVVNGNGHLNFDGEITQYDVRSIDITRQEIATSNRLTIAIRVKYSNEIDDQWDFDNSFSAYADFQSEKSLSEVEDALIEEILPQIIDDIYNKAVVNW